MINIEQLAQHWVHSSEEETPAIKGRIYRPEDSMKFPPSRFRMRYIFYADGRCQYYYLAPNDAHQFREGTWQMRSETAKIIEIHQELGKVSYQIIELTAKLLRMVPIS